MIIRKKQESKKVLRQLLKGYMPMLVVVIVVMMNGKVLSQSCNCDHTFSNLSSTTINVIDASSYSYSPGERFCIPAGNYAGLRLVGFEGTVQDPIEFINCDGLVTLDGGNYPGLDLKQSKFIHIAGTGEQTVEYGLNITSQTSGLAVSSFSTDVEIDHVEITNVGFAGILAKTDPNCSDTMTWRENGFVMRNLDIHDNYIHDTHGEGVYIGSTHGYRVVSTLTCNGDYVFPHWLEDVSVHHNRFENIGWDGIQLNLVRSGGEIHHNTILNYGTQEQNFQNFAMSIGGGIYNVYNNLMENEGQAKGMQFISVQSGTKIFNNILLDPKSDGIFIHGRHELDDLTQGYFILNNTIVNPEKAGVKFSAAIVHSEDPNMVGVLQNYVPSYFVNNAILNPGNEFETGGTWKGESENYIDFDAVATRDSMIPNMLTNLLSKQLDTLGFVDVMNYDFQSVSLSGSAVNSGTDVSSFGVLFDFNDLNRPQGVAYDIGAYEFDENTNSTEEVTDQEIDLFKVGSSNIIRIAGLKSERYEFELFDIKGQKMIDVTLNGAETKDVQVPELGSGIYFVVLRGTGSIVSGKVLVE